MYYLLGFKLLEQDIPTSRKDVIADNTFLLALDGDIDFTPLAVTLLVDLMKKNTNLGAACGRIHPVGGGELLWGGELLQGYWGIICVTRRSTEGIVWFLLGLRSN